MLGVRSTLQGARARCATLEYPHACLVIAQLGGAEWTSGQQASSKYKIGLAEHVSASHAGYVCLHVVEIRRRERTHEHGGDVDAQLRSRELPERCSASVSSCSCKLSPAAESIMLAEHGPEECVLA